MISKDRLRDIALKGLDSCDERLDRLQRDLDKLTIEQAAIEEKLKGARSAKTQMLDYDPKPGTEYLCPTCWCSDGSRSILRPVPSDSRNDNWLCAAHDHEFTF